MVAIKSRLHNQAYVHLRRKLGSLPSLCIIDQFVQAKSYYRYLHDVEEVVHTIHFETKAENKYLSVAAGSIIARYAFYRHLMLCVNIMNFPLSKELEVKWIRQYVLL